MVYRTMYVAVKYLHVHTLKEDVQNEAEMTAALCHPFLPYLYGLCTETQPYRLVFQFHGFIKASPLSLTVRRELDQQVCKLQTCDWISAIAQLLDAVEYLHSGPRNDNIYSYSVMYFINNTLTKINMQGDECACDTLRLHVLP